MSIMCIGALTMFAIASLVLPWKVKVPVTAILCGVPVVIMVAMLLGVVAHAAVARADTQDDQFLQTVRAQGVTVDAAVLIAFAHQMCDTVGSPAALGPLTNLMMTQGLSAQQASNVAFAGTGVYCPEKTPVVPPGLMPAPLA